MAILTAQGTGNPLEFGLDFATGIDLNWYITDVVDAAFYDNFNISMFGYIYQDVITLDASDGIDYDRLTFGGTGFVVGPDYTVYAGTVTGITETDLMTGTTTFRLEQISISGVDLQNAMITPSNADEMALLFSTLAGNDTITLGNSRDRVYGFAGDDWIDGGGANDILRGDSGNDTLIGGLGDDALGGGTENDDLRGMTGNDTLLGDLGNDLLAAAGGNDYLDGGDGADTMNGGAGNDSMLGGIGNDSIAGAGNNDTIDGGSGNNTISGGLGLDSIRGGAQADLLAGDAGADTLFGGSGNDTLSGGSEIDNLAGEDGNDRLIGGFGPDIMTGGTGSDRFIWNVNDFGTGLRSGVDRITDFSRADFDKIDLSLIDASTTAAGNNAFTFIGTAVFSGTGGQLRYVQVAGNTYVEGDRNGDSAADFAIRLDGLVALTAGDFIL